MLLQLSCIGQDTTALDQQILELATTYKKYVEHKHDYGLARDTVIVNFQNKLEKLAKDSRFESVHAEQLGQTEGIYTIVSKDQKFMAISWDLYNGGCDHIYNCLFVHKDNNESNKVLVSHNYPQEINDEVEASFEYPYKIFQLDTTTYVLQNTRLTCGSGRYITFRMFNTANQKLLESKEDFKGEREFRYLANRGDTILPKFDTNTKKITYPKLKPVLLDGEDTGFQKPSGHFNTLVFQDGKYVEINKKK